jgi:hypothetical protein
LILSQLASEQFIHLLVRTKPNDGQKLAPFLPGGHERQQDFLAKSGSTMSCWGPVDPDIQQQPVSINASSLHCRLAQRLPSLGTYSVESHCGNPVADFTLSRCWQSRWNQPPTFLSHHCPGRQGGFCPHVKITLYAIEPTIFARQAFLDYRCMGLATQAPHGFELQVYAAYMGCALSEETWTASIARSDQDSTRISKLTAPLMKQIAASLVSDYPWLSGDPQELRRKV